MRLAPIVGLCLSLAVALLSGADAASRTSSPVYAPAGRWSKDPCVLRAGGQWYLYVTDIRGLHVARSNDLTRWVDDRPVTIQGETSFFVWAPSVLEQRGTYFLYYCAGDLAPGGGIAWPSFRLRVATSTDPRGPYRLVGDLITPPRPFAGWNDVGLIDPEVVRDDDGTLYCFYVAVLQGLPRRRHHWEGVRVRRLASPTAVDPASPDTRVIDPAQPWHENIVEAPMVVRVARGQWAILYSGGPASRGQRFGTAYAPRLMGPGGGGDRTWSLEKGGVPAPGQVSLLTGWNRASVGSSCLARDASGRLALIYQGLNVAEWDAQGRPFDAPGRAWTIGIDRLLIASGRLILTPR